MTATSQLGAIGMWNSSSTRADGSIAEYGIGNSGMRSRIEANSLPPT
jgi:hypothetical protein